MYIDTHSKGAMEKSLCDLFHMQPLELQEQLMALNRDTRDDDNIDKLEAFIIEKATAYPDEILLFHLARRLHGTEDATEGRNLADLLLSINPFSSFMKKNGIEFEKETSYIEVIYKGRKINWNNCFWGNPDYMKSRLGYFKNQDFCFNGFAMKDLLYRSNYAKNLSRMPEFLDNLVRCLQCESVGQEYTKDSEYFCYEYKLPLSKVIFDGHDDYSDMLEKKQLYLLRCVLQRLYQYQTSNYEDDNNPILRVADNYTIPSEYYIGREKMTFKC